MSSTDSTSTSTSNTTRPMVAFDNIPYEEVVWGEILGKGAFGSVYKGSYLGIDVAIKEITPSQKYHVMKYFEREWRIMAECRHPNIVLFLGLCMAPKDDGRCFIVSEYVPKGNLRSFMLGRRPFPWRLRLSFATDIARAIAYLHARDCVHRDIKGENLLITSNDRIKVTDFGFARIVTASSDEERQRRQMTHCGTEWYMSPEMVSGDDFDLPTDVYTLGLVFIELLSRRLVAKWLFVLDDNEVLVVDLEEVYRVASPNCPPKFIQLALDCCAVEQEKRPKMPEVLERLRAIEVDVCARLTEDDGGEHVGSISIVKPGRARAMPDFSKPTDDELSNGEVEARVEEEAMVALSRMKIDIDGSGASEVDEGLEGRGDGEGDSGMETWRTARWRERSDITMSSESSFGHKQHLLVSGSKYHDSLSSFDQLRSGSSGSTAPVVAVENASVMVAAAPPPDTALSTMTIKAPMSTPPSGYQVMRENSDSPVKEDAVPPETPIPPQSQIQDIPSLNTSRVGTGEKEDVKGLGLEQKETRELDTAEADGDQDQEGESDQGNVSRVMGTHRFSVLNKDLLELHSNDPKKKEKGGSKAFTSVTSALSFFSWNKPQAAANVFWKRDQGPTVKCAVCKKRLGHRPALECDDCGTVVHATCSHSTPRDCQVWEQVTE